MPGLDLGRAPCPVHIPTKDRASLLPNPLGSCIGLSGGGVVIRVVGGWNIASGRQVETPGQGHQEA